MKRSKNLLHKLAAIATTGVFLTASADAFATAVTLRNVTDNVATAATGVPRVIQLGAYVGGAFLASTGILSLKKHSENPGNEPLGKGLGRLAGGAGLLASPFAMAAMQGSINNGSSLQADASSMIIESTSVFGQ